MRLWRSKNSTRHHITLLHMTRQYMSAVALAAPRSGIKISIRMEKWKIDRKFKSKELRALVLATVKEEGEVSIDEIETFLKDRGIELERIKIIDYIRKSKAKGILATSYFNERTVYKMAAIRPWFVSLNMATLLEDQSAFDNALEKIDKTFKAAATGPGTNTYRNYKPYEVVIETIDPILGGVPTNEKNKMAMRRDADNKPIIAAQQLRAWTRDNLYLSETPSALFRWITYTDAYPLEEDVKLIKLKARGAPGAGYFWHEAWPAETKLRFSERIPLTARANPDPVGAILKMYELAEKMPRRGLGANPFAYGGKIRLVELKPV